MVEGTLDPESKVSDLNPHSLTNCMVLDRLLLCLRLHFSQLQREGSPYSLLQHMFIQRFCAMDIPRTGCLIVNMVSNPLNTHSIV